MAAPLAPGLGLAKIMLKKGDKMEIYKDCRNPVLPPKLHIPDPEAHVMPDGRVYVYGSWDKTDETYCSREYRVISSANMVDWTDHGISFSSSQVGWLADENAPKYPNTDWDFSNPTPFLADMMKQFPAPEGDDGQGAEPPADFVPKPDYLYAPDAIHKNGTYYLYFCCSNSSEGVAVSDNPQGPFENPVRLKCGGIDPAVFVDDDGQAYYFWGQFRASGAKLKDNMMELDEETIVAKLVTEEAHGFHEGSSLRKRGDTYYFVYPRIKSGSPTTLAYATSKAPLGPYTYRGAIISNKNCDPSSWNIHGSIEEVNGRWYVFYHRSSGNSQYMRRLCIEPIFFNRDGSIDEVQMTSQGAGRPFALGETMEAWRACELLGGAFIQENGLVQAAENGTAVFRYTNWDAPAKNAAMQAKGTGTVAVYVDGAHQGSVEVVDGVGGKLPVHAAAGRHELSLIFSKVEGLEFESITFS